MRFFNIAGPCVAADHYMLPATERLPEVIGMIRRKLYFVIHAPRQSGKTTALKQLVRDINGAGERVALYCSLETLQNVTDVASAMSTVETVIWKAVRTSAAFADIAGGIRDYALSAEVTGDPATGVRFDNAFYVRAH